ncbi:hypothetical protein ACOKFD_01065 [Flagellimonas sp. S174]|uniref:hypothetical protein n=1 Tax=Flagellimonas sp. S174 TaxID=3410790 RepID=UPI002629D979|nr:hypothetical protein [uncultured Allomuricauda sp.]
MTDKKQGDENFEIAKEEKKEKRNYIFQKNTKTKTGFVLIIVFLAILILAVAATQIFL